MLGFSFAFHISDVIVAPLASMASHEFSPVDVMRSNAPCAPAAVLVLYSPKKRPLRVRMDTKRDQEKKRDKKETQKRDKEKSVRSLKVK
jgi:hypothetical protein